MANDKIQKSAYGTTRAIIKASDVDDREPIWNADLKELLVEYSADNWWEFPSEARLYTGIDPTGLIEFPRNLVGDQASGAHLIGVQDGFTNFSGNRHLHAALQSIDTALGNRIHKNGSPNMEEDFILEKNVAAGDNQLVKVPHAAVNSLGDTNLGTAEPKELVFNGTFNVNNFPSLGWEYTGNNPDQIAYGDSYVQFQNPTPTNPTQSTTLKQPAIVIPESTYTFKYEVLTMYDNSATIQLRLGTGGDSDLVSLTEHDVGEHEVEITTTDDRIGFSIQFSCSAYEGLVGVWRITNFSLKEKQTNRIGVSDNWHSYNPVDLITTGKDLIFTPSVLTASGTYATIFIAGVINQDEWYEVKYDVTANSDANSEISAYIKQENSEFTKAVKLDLVVGIDKKVIFKSPVDSSTLRIEFFCNTATPSGSVRLDNFYVKKVILGDTYVAKDIKIGNNIIIKGSISNAAIGGYLNIQTSVAQFTSQYFYISTGNSSVLNSTFIYCTEPAFISVSYLKLYLPSVPVGSGNSNTIGRIYIIRNDTQHIIRVETSGSEKIYGSTSQDYVTLYIDNFAVFIATNDPGGLNAKHWMFFRLPYSFSY